MEYVIDTTAGFVQRIEIADVAFAKINLVENLGEVLALAGRKIVDAAYFIALRQQDAGDG